MTNKLQVFNNEEFGSVRTVTIDGEPWFVGKDVAEAFGDTNYRRSLARLDEDEKGVSQISTLGGMQSMTIINESGLYSLLFYMQPKKAKGVSQNDTLLQERIDKLHKFKHWITSEVIPSIRKHGVYMTDNLLDAVIDNPQVVQQVIEKLNADRNKAAMLEEELNNALPKAAYYDTFVDPGYTTNFRDTAKEMGIPQKKFIELLMEHKFVFRTQKNELRPSSKALENGLFVLKDYTNPINFHRGTYTLVTARGKKYIYEYFTKKELI